MNSFFALLFAICIASLFLRHVASKYKDKEESEFFLKDWMKVLGVVFIFSNVFYSEKIMNFILEFVFLGSLDKSPFFATELKMGQAFLISSFLVLVLSFVFSFISSIKEVIKGDAFLGKGPLSLLGVPFVFFFFFVGHLFFISFLYAIYFFFAVFLTGISSGELTGRETDKVFSWLAISFLASIFHNLIIDGYRKNRYGSEESREKFFQEKRRLKSEIGDKKRYLETVKGEDSVVFQKSSFLLNSLKGQLKDLKADPKLYFEERDKKEENV
ncbi:MAG: hypothetical protein RI945_229 [Candidatus Parcubacteria bacterium]|jgi:hypothetical protein